MPKGSDKWKRKAVTTGLTMTGYKRRMRARATVGGGTKECQRRIRQRINRLMNILRPFLSPINSMIGVTESEVGRFFFPGQYLPAGSSVEALAALEELDQLWQGLLRPLSEGPTAVEIDVPIEALASRPFDGVTEAVEAVDGITGKSKPIVTGIL